MYDVREKASQLLEEESAFHQLANWAQEAVELFVLGYIYELIMMIIHQNIRFIA